MFLAVPSKVKIEEEAENDIGKYSTILLKLN